MNLIILLLAQPLLYEGNCSYFESFWDFYTDNRISSSACSMGYTGVASTGDIPNTFINPASLSLENKKQVYFEYVYKDDIEWIADIKYKNLNPNFSMGFGLPINNYLQTGISYRTENSLKADYELIGTAVSDTAPAGYIVTGIIEAYRDFKISSFSVPVVFKLKDIFSVGIDLSYTNFYSKQTLGEAIYTDGDSTWTEPNIVTVNFNKIRPNFGIIVSPLENLSLGLTYLPETRENVSIELTDTTVTYNEPNIFPLKIGIGIGYKFNTTPLSLYLDYKYSKNSAEDGLVNRNDIHFGLGYDINNNITIRGGFFTQGDYRTLSSQSNSALFGLGNLDQIFTTLGIAYKVNSLALNLSLMDSHIFSDGPIKQTYVNTGISYGF